MQDCRVPPHSKEAEEAILRDIFIDPSALERIKSRLSPEDFYFTGNERLYRIMLSLHESSIPVTHQTVIDEVKNELELRIKILSEIPVPSDYVPNAEAYADIIRERSILRELISLAGKMIDSLIEGTKNSKEILDESVDCIKEIEKRC
jgi:replicative DNA helicase